MVAKISRIRGMVKRKLSRIKSFSRQDLRNELRSCKKLINEDMRRTLESHVKRIVREHSIGEIKRELGRLNMVVSWKLEMMPYYHALRKKTAPKKKAKKEEKGAKKAAKSVRKKAAGKRKR